MERYIILDIDRTIVNGTSWFHACTCPNLLISEDKIPTFKQLNETLYNNGTRKEKIEFIQKTFELIGNKISEDSIRLLESEVCLDDLWVGRNIDEKFLECVGKYTLKKIIDIDFYCKKILSLLNRYYTGNIKIVFLTSGYEAYMNGLITLYMESFEEKFDWKVVGTTLNFNNGEMSIKKQITQSEKYYYVKNLIFNGSKVVFLADDSKEDLRLFDIVKENGGYVFQVEYDPMHHSLNWNILYQVACDNSFWIEFLTKKSEIKVQLKHENASNFYENHCNEIGIITLDILEYNDLCNSINDETLCKLIQQFIYRKDDCVYLRGYLYYYWLPPYLNISFENKYDRWKRLYSAGYSALRYINRKNISEGKWYNLIVYMITEHLLAALYLAIYCIEERDITLKSINLTDYEKMQIAVEKIDCIIFSIFEGQSYITGMKELEEIIGSIDTSNLHIINDSKKYLLELDNYTTIFRAAKNIVEELEKKAVEIDAVICFAYGGIAIGYAVQTVLNYYRNCKVKLFTSHYSSKRFVEEKDIIDQIPKINRKDLWMDGCKVLLVDNNATTFKTLQCAKKYLTNRKNDVFCAVAEVDYENVSRWLLDDGKYEEMCDGWYDVIDFHPVNKYISAYNTWGTSKKSVVLENIYQKSITALDVNNICTKKICSKHRKICRVHNIYDLYMALSMGATMIGIHAVISQKNKYYASEKFSGVQENKYPDLPVPDYEVDGIRNMVNHIPESVLPVLVIEKELSMDEIMEIVKLYGLEKEKTGIQFQLMANSDYISEVISLGFEHIILSVGVMQKNASIYIRRITQVLRDDVDYILIDMSKHQPQLLADDANKYKDKFENKMEKLLLMVDTLKNVELPILLADDLSPKELILCQLTLLSRGVNLVGLDMQNNIELNKSEQGYCLIVSDNQKYYVKIRKSIDKIRKWIAYEPYISE